MAHLEQFEGLIGSGESSPIDLK
ncbi:hypothetical protein A2U01_0092501 [Trifolium medium]|uniref:Uncharacterized protein n=1 Tax=Trifolium medium TaxID=97028 RepID=A0A392UDX2_9FABA|nr:hypothetical protein [Trifolium medium]